MWIPNRVVDLIFSFGKRFEDTESALRVITGQTAPLAKLQADVNTLIVDGASDKSGAELVAVKVADEIHEFAIDHGRLAALDGENGALRARVVQQETTIKLLLTQLELSGARESQLIAQLGVRLHLPVQTHVPGAPTTHPIAPAGVTDAQGVPVSTPADADAALKLLSHVIRETGGGSAQNPSQVGTPGELPANLFDEPDDDGKTVDVPESV